MTTEHGLCDECPHQTWPTGSEPGCELIGGACALGARLKTDGPWPPDCPRCPEKETVTNG